MSDEQTLDGTEADETTDTEAETPEGIENVSETDTDTADTETAEDTEGETFSRAYVEKLRHENSKLRVRAQDADETRHRLHRALVEATGKLADPADLEYSEDHLADPEALTAAIDELLAAKPHLRSRTPKGDAGQGKRGSGAEPTNLLTILKQFA